MEQREKVNTTITLYDGQAGKIRTPEKGDGSG